MSAARRRLALRGLQAALLAVLQAAAPPASASPGRNILDLQPYQRSSSVAAAGLEATTATLIDLNPAVHAWYLLRLEGPAGRDSYHLENADPEHQQLRLAADGLELTDPHGTRGCALWGGAAAQALERARRSGLPYAPLCDDRVHLRNRVRGNQTRLEVVTDFLRDHVWGGEQIVGFVKRTFYQDAFVEQARPAAPPTAAAAAVPGAPPPARIEPGAAGAAILAEHLGIDLGSTGNHLQLGRWYAVPDAAGIHVSAVQPQAIEAALLRTDRDRVNALDPVEAAAVDYLVAFDLAQFELGFALGTDHPRLDWSDRTPAAQRDPALPGPDGIDSADPLVANGMISPALLPRVAATFTGGFKRAHSAFRYGPLAQVNSGSHYGFMEQGVLFSTLQPGLATLYVLDGGGVGMNTWGRSDTALLPHLRHARQNGVPLVEYDAARKAGRPGALVRSWGAGNWSGSSDEQLRTLRAGACLREDGERRFLIYGWFSTATPSAMARVFQAYGCREAMQLDINALEHTYLAIYTHRENRVLVQHLIRGMDVLDRSSRGRVVPRFLGFPDDRDFFYLMRRRR